MALIKEISQEKGALSFMKRNWDLAILILVMFGLFTFDMINFRTPFFVALIFGLFIFLKSFIQLRNNQERFQIIEHYTNEWLSVGLTMVLSLYLLFQIVNPDSTSDILFVGICILVFATQAWHKRYNRYILSQKGIYRADNLSLLLESKEIISIRFESDQISIDTTDYLNHFIFKKSKLHQPSWEKLQADFLELQSVLFPEVLAPIHEEED